MLLFLFYFVFSELMVLPCVLPSFFIFFFKFDYTSFNSFFLLVISFFFDFKLSLLFFVFFCILLGFFFQRKIPCIWWPCVFFYFKCGCYSFYGLSSAIGAGLWNGLVLIHPLFTFFSYFFLIFFYFLVYFQYLKIKDFFFYKRCCLYFFFVCSLASLILGSWWAQQEMNWGGWWGWDPIELGSFFFFFLVCFCYIVNLVRRCFQRFLHFFFFFF